ncbi:double-strand break repair helicase AddA [Aestuariibius sp. 2305UL40-4]|uniref:double-strand break repair helicase AddA n=1 Tax=Aestuariibius violaceus TaxID=3234132 RepID=UPI00345E91CD
MSVDEATRRQQQAADPERSTWLAANAGSGKTRVLTDRVARLLLGGVDPQKILCLTYTKAAASEMQNRLFRRLGEWAMMAPEDLRQNLSDLGVTGPVSATRIAEARRLFARAIETPGGLKIQTIHSFCATLLRRFPLEAGVSPGFVEMDDRSAQQLRADVLDRIAADAPETLQDFARHHATIDLDKLLADIARQRDLFLPPRNETELRAALGLMPGENEASLLAQTVAPGDAGLIADLVAVCAAGSANDQKVATKLSAIAARGEIAYPDLADLEDVFLYGETAANPFGPKSGTIPTKATLKAAPHFTGAADLDHLMERVAAGRDRRLALLAFQSARALHHFAQDFLPALDRAKEIRGWLDFDDLIRKARQLLTDPAVAQWVLFRLDGGIDHILVDEAQDTSPDQWEVIRDLAQEFTAGAGARPGIRRTIFVVGDLKQSIYSFQGADPAEFERLKAHFAERLDATGDPLAISSLDYSFRSAAPILRLVDEVFRDRPGVGDAVLHRPFRPDLPGRVDLWPMIEREQAEESGDWTDPVDRIQPGDPKVRLAREIASEIKRMTEEETIPVSRNGTVLRRPVDAGDILVLVQRRGPLFSEIIRACKAQGIEVAGADRLKVIEELAVKDILAVLAFLALPEDDLALASALKSPLFGWDEGALFTLAQPRPEGQHLWQALRDQRDHHPETLEILDDLRAQSDFLRPYELIERLLTRHDGRERLLARLGEEAEDAIDALLGLAIDYERTSVPSLTGFLEWIRGDEIEIKRELGAARGKLRVMTVHGAKGLEAPIVVLPDTAPRKPPDPPRIYDTNGLGLPALNKAQRPPVLASVADAHVARLEAERNRLLYVAMTRAESWLICCGAAPAKDSKNEGWHDAIRAGLDHTGAYRHAFPTGDGLRLSHLEWDGPVAETSKSQKQKDSPIPLALLTPPPRAERPAPTLSPSALGGLKTLPGEAAGADPEAARLHGVLVHRLLETLPDAAEEDHPAIINALAAEVGDEVPLAPALQEARAILHHPDFQSLFAPGTLSEVAISAALDALDGQRIHGTIDRLMVTDTRVLAVDYKTNRVAPDDPKDTPDGILRQMGAYEAALSEVYPDHEIQTAILWTAGPELMLLPHDLVSGALTTARPA